jgi:hypothetical protein
MTARTRAVFYVSRQSYEPGGSMQARRVSLLAILCGIVQTALAISDNDYNDHMVTIGQDFAACVGGYYKHDIHWGTLPAKCCGWNTIDVSLMYDTYEGGMDIPLDWRIYQQHVTGPKCLIVPHNRFFRLMLYAEASPQSHWWWISDYVVTIPTPCTGGQ